MGVLFVLKKLIVMACNIGFASLGVEAEIADVFDYFPKVVFVFADQLDVLLLLINEDTRLVLLTSELAFKVGNTSSLN